MQILEYLVLNMKNKYITESPWSPIKSQSKSSNKAKYLSTERKRKNKSPEVIPSLTIGKRFYLIIGYLYIACYCFRKFYI